MAELCSKSVSSRVVAYSNVPFLTCSFKARLRDAKVANPSVVVFSLKTAYAEPAAQEQDKVSKARENASCEANAPLRLPAPPSNTHAGGTPSPCPVVSLPHTLHARAERGQGQLHFVAKRVTRLHPHSPPTVLGANMQYTTQLQYEQKVVG
eukprot:3873678-Pleurochrysis_carterae.AAC.2